MSAGILPIWHGRVLLGFEQGGWSPFSGEVHANETQELGAWREFMEETAGIFDGEYIWSKISRAAAFRSQTPSGNTFVLYIISFDDFDPTCHWCVTGEGTALDTPNQLFLESKKKTRRRCEREKQQLRWMNLDRLTRIQIGRAHV